MPTQVKPKLFAIEAHKHFSRVKCLICDKTFSVANADAPVLTAADRMIGHALEHLISSGVRCTIHVHPPASAEPGQTDANPNSPSPSTTETQRESSPRPTPPPSAPPSDSPAETAPQQQSHQSESSSNAS